MEWYAVAAIVSPLLVLVINLVVMPTKKDIRDTNARIDRLYELLLQGQQIYRESGQVVYEDPNYTWRQSHKLKSKEEHPPK